MEKEIIISVSPYVQKYYLNETYKDLPVAIKEEIIEKLSLAAEKTNCILSIGFYENGEMFIEERHEDPMFYDDIGAALEIKQLQTEHEELFKSLKMWYMIYCTENGRIVKEIVLLQSQKLSTEDIFKAIEKKYGADGKDFAKQLLEEA